MNTEVLYKKIMEDLLADIRNGKYLVGSRLPSEMELADAYGVSRITSKKAVEILADRGFVMRKPGRGTFVVSVETEGGRPAAAEQEEITEPSEEPKRKTIGVIIDNFDNVFGDEVLKGLEYECRRRGMLMMLRLTYGSIDVEKEAIREMREAGVSGIVLMCAQGEVSNTDILKLYLEKFPLILVDRGMKGVPIPTVMTDNRAAAYEMTGALIARGHRQIGFISHSYLTTSTISDRFEGFCDALNDNGIMMNESLLNLNMDAFLPEDTDTEKDRNVYNDLLCEFVDSHPEVTAYFAVENRIAMNLYQILCEKGLESDRMIACFDSTDYLHNMKNILCVDQDQYRMGVSAMRLMAHKLRGEIIPTKEIIPYTMEVSENPSVSLPGR